MKIPVIKKLVEAYDLDELRNAEEALLEENTPIIDIDGEDEGEKLTHAWQLVLDANAAYFIKFRASL